MSSEHEVEVRPALRRPRPVLSCLECRRKKLKCDRLLPCQQCLKLSQPSLCSYAPGQEPERRDVVQIRESNNKRVRRDSSVGDIGVNRASSSTVDLRERVQKLEEALAAQRGAQSSPNTNNIDTTSIAPTRLQSSGLDPQPSDVLPNIDDGLSIYRKFPDAARFGISVKQIPQEPGVQSITKQLSALDQASTAPAPAQGMPISTYTNLTHLIDHMIRRLPSQQVCNKLIALYFENFEHCTRILHKTFFLLEKHEFEHGNMEDAQKQYFVPALVGVLCMASNLNTYPECDIHTLQTSRNDTNVISLLDNWYELMAKRDSATIPVIQVRLLTLQVQKHRNVDAATLWIASAQLIRQAMIQDLHREPPETMSNLEAEIRRNLWLSILEQDLALAISCGMTPQCPTYDLRPPSNCDDSELSVYTCAGPSHHSVHQWTDGLCQHILGTTFNQRLRAYQHRFAPKNSSHYEQTLRYTRELEIILRELPPQFRLDHAANTPGRLMAQMDLDITLRRPLIALYGLYAKADPIRDVYREMRIPWVQSNLIVMCFQDLFDVQFPAIDVPRPNGYWDFYYTAYNYDVKQSVEAMLTEGQYLKRIESMQPRPNHLSSGNTPNASSVKCMPWDFAAMIKSLEDSLGPMSRRIGPYRGDLRTVVRYSLLLDCLRTPENEIVDKYVFDGLQGLISAVQRRLERDGAVIHTDPQLEPNLHSSVDWLLHYLNLDE